jgi:ribosomal protein S18 acetylase RimI-like enzyme
MAKITRRRAVAGDVEFARRVHHEAYRDVVVRQFGRWDEGLQNRFFMEGWKSELTEIVLCDGVPCGCLSVVERAAGVVVRNIALLPEFQGRGIGTGLLAEVMERAGERGVPVRLDVLHQNRARKLYERIGFGGGGGQ